MMALGRLCLLIYTLATLFLINYSLNTRLDGFFGILLLRELFSNTTLLKRASVQHVRASALEQWAMGSM